MKKYVTLVTLIWLLLLSNFLLYAQTITRTTSSVVAGTVCSVSATFYEVSVPSGFTSCQINWSATNGTVTKDPNDQRKAKVEWNDTPGATGTVTATFSNCGSGNEGNNGVSKSLSELILSVKNKSWDHYDPSITVDYCTKASVNIIVPRMFVQGTGGIAQPPRVEVAYAWTLPDGWKEVGTNRTGSFGTSINMITIEPSGCSKKGSVTVFGTLAGAGPYCNSAEKSETATIALNSADPVATVGPQPGYTGGSACNTAPVTFYATTQMTLGCINSYDWTYPPSWSFISQSGNSITLQPTGIEADANPMKATITFACGSSITSGNYTPPFNKPIISSPSAICFGGTTVTLMNVGPATTVNWNPGSNMVIKSGQGTPSVVLRGATVNTKQLGKINATISCANVPVPQKSVWVGKAKMVAKLDNNQLITYSTMYNEVCNYTSYKTVMDVTGSSFNTWDRIAASPANTSWYPSGNNISFNFWAVGQTATYRLTSGNNCGSNVYDFRFRSKSCTSNPCSAFNVSPNPSNNEINIVAPNIPAPCSQLMTISTFDAEKNKEEVNEEVNEQVIESITLLSLDGQILRSEKFPSGTKDVKMDVSGIKTGVYILKVFDGKQTETHRLQINE